jgi:PST family polysaccharide transporter
VLTKLFAILLGPSGIAVLGNMKSVMQILMSSASFGMQRGIIRFTSEFREQRHAFQKLLGTLHIIYGSIALVIAVVLFFLSDYLANVILQDDKYAWLFQILAIVVPFQGFHVLYFSILQGLDNYKKVVWVELVMIFCNLIFVSVSTFKFGLTGALFSVACMPVFYFFVSVVLLKSDIPNFKIAWSSSTAKNLFLYALMTLFSGIAFPLLFILIRNHISSVLGIDEVGYWEAINQFSFFYFILLNSVMLMYVLPKITAQTDNLFYRSQVVEYVKKIMPLFAVFLIVLFLLRRYAILVLLSPEFSSIETLFGWQLLGDFFRAMTLIFSIYFHARRLAVPYITIDALLIVLLFTLTTVFVDSYGLIGAVKAHFISYFIYFIVTVFWLRKTLFNTNDAVNA